MKPRATTKWLSDLLQPHGKGILERAVGAIPNQMQKVDPQFSLSRMAKPTNTEAGKEAARLKREERAAATEKRAHALAVVAGARPAHNVDGGGPLEFRLGVPLGRGRSSVGLLHAWGTEVPCSELGWRVRGRWSRTSASHQMLNSS